VKHNEAKQSYHWAECFSLKLVNFLCVLFDQVEAFCENPQREKQKKIQVQLLCYRKGSKANI
jgi:hypothetical protein